MLININKELSLRADKILWIAAIDPRSSDYEAGFRAEIMFEGGHSLFSKYTFDQLSGYLEEYRRLANTTQWVYK